MHEAGARALEQLLAGVGSGPLAEPLVCARNHLPARMQSLGLKEKRLRLILGEVTYRRSAYRCPQCGSIRYPGDELLHIEATGFSPGARRMMAYEGSRDCFRHGAEDLDFLAGLHVDAKDVERTAEKTGRQVDDWMCRQASLATLKPPAETPRDTICRV